MTAAVVIYALAALGFAMWTWDWHPEDTGLPYRLFFAGLTALLWSVAVVLVASWRLISLFERVVLGR